MCPSLNSITNIKPNMSALFAGVSNPGLFQTTPSSMAICVLWTFYLSQGPQSLQYQHHSALANATAVSSKWVITATIVGVKARLV